jgi:hypothetical protein
MTKIIVPRIKFLYMILEKIYSCEMKESEIEFYRDIFESELHKLRLDLEELKALKELFKIKQSVLIKYDSNVKEALDNSKILIEIQNTGKRYNKKLHDVIF